MHRRGAGIAAIKNKDLAQAKFRDKGSEIASEQLAQLSKHLESFKMHLEDFARKHREDIKKDPQFRRQDMCATIGVDPLASGKGFWSEMLGVGDFYYELGVQIIEVCMATNHRNGGIMSLEELLVRLVAASGRNRQDVSINDLLMAIKKLKVLGNGFSLIPISKGRYLVQAVPVELMMDHTAIIQKAETKGYVTASELRQSMKWSDERTSRALDYLIKEGLVWVDDQSKEERTYWFPGLFDAVKE